MVESLAHCRDKKASYTITNGILRAEGGDGMMDHLFSMCISHEVKFEDTGFNHDRGSLIENWDTDRCILSIQPTDKNTCVCNPSHHKIV
jgi:hypothetical protein